MLLFVDFSLKKVVFFLSLFFLVFEYSGFLFSFFVFMVAGIGEILFRISITRSFTHVGFLGLSAELTYSAQSGGIKLPFLSKWPVTQQCLSEDQKLDPPSSIGSNRSSTFP